MEAKTEDKMISESALFDWLVKGFVAVLAWLGINLHSRVSTLEKESATKTGLSDAITDLKETMKDHREETRQGFSELRTILLKKPDRGE